jgi:hypothetical protein
MENVEDIRKMGMATDLAVRLAARHIPPALQIRHSTSINPNKHGEWEPVRSDLMEEETTPPVHDDTPMPIEEFLSTVTTDERHAYELDVLTSVYGSRSLAKSVHNLFRYSARVPYQGTKLVDRDGWLTDIVLTKLDPYIQAEKFTDVANFLVGVIVPILSHKKWIERSPDSRVATLDDVIAFWHLPDDEFLGKTGYTKKIILALPTIVNSKAGIVEEVQSSNFTKEVPKSGLATPDDMSDSEDDNPTKPPAATKISGKEVAVNRSEVAEATDSRLD